MFLVSQLLIKATYFFYRFNYLVSDVLMLLVCNNQPYLLSSTRGRCFTPTELKVLLHRYTHKFKPCLKFLHTCFTYSCDF